MTLNDIVYFVKKSSITELEILIEMLKKVLIEKQMAESIKKEESIF